MQDIWGMQCTENFFKFEVKSLNEEGGKSAFFNGKIFIARF